MRRQRSTLILDTVPELYPYRDDGCEVAPSCLDCPLPQCKYDDPMWYRRERRSQRDQKVLRIQAQKGLTVAQLARHFGVSQRTIFRILRRSNNGKSER